MITMASFSQEDGSFFHKYKLSDGTWKTNTHCFVHDSVEVYTLTAMDEMQYQWGNMITFSDSTFTTDYFAPCGVDCFTDVHGTYKYCTTFGH